MEAKKYPVKITVFRKFDLKDIDDYVEGGCKAVEEGQEFIVGIDGKMPEGFCTWAWADLWTPIVTLRFGGNFTYSKTPGRYWGCCSDGRFPVVFMLQRIEE